MRVVVIVILVPSRDQVSGMAQARKQVFVQALIPKAAIEALHETVLHRFDGRDVVPFDLPVLLPFQDRVAGQFGAIVGHHQAGIATQIGDLRPVPWRPASPTVMYPRQWPGIPG